MSRTPIPTLDKLSTEALEALCRALAERGQDFGWDVYYRGNRVDPRALHADEGGLAWLEAFRSALAAYRAKTGKAWRF